MNGERHDRPRAVLLGASVAGAAAAIQLARRGWEVTVLDPDLGRFDEAAQVPSVRPGAPHAVHGHVWTLRTAVELRDRLPDVYDGLLAEGIHEMTLADRAPASLVDGGRPGDEALTSLVMRRLVLDRVLWRVLSGEPRVSVCPARAAGLVTNGRRPPRVLGVRLASGAAVTADVVLDCTGRRTRVTSWLASHGAVEEVVERECGVSYYTRHYRIGPGERPGLSFGNAQAHFYPRALNLWLLGDGDHATLAMAVHGKDPCLKRLRRADALEAAAHADPDLAPWLEISAPTTEVLVMGSVRNRLRRVVVDGEPVVLGLHHLGDALANSNPTHGRGVAMTLASASVLVDLLTEHPHDQRAQAMGYDAWVSGLLSLYWREASAADEGLGDRLLAGVRGVVRSPSASPVELDGAALSSAALERAAGRDPDLFRTLTRAVEMLDDSRDVASARTAQRVSEVLARADEPGQEEVTTPQALDRQRTRLEDPTYLDELLAPYG